MWDKILLNSVHVWIVFVWKNIREGALRSFDTDIEIQNAEHITFLFCLSEKFCKNKLMLFKLLIIQKAYI